MGSNREQHAVRSWESTQCLSFDSQVVGARRCIDRSRSCSAVNCLIEIIGVDNTPPQAPHRAIRCESAKHVIDHRAKLLIEKRYRFMNFRHAETKFRLEIPPIRKANAAGTKDQSLVTFHHKHEIFLNESTCCIKRMQICVDLDSRRVRRMHFFEMCDEYLKHFLSFVFSVVERAERRRRMRRHNLRFLRKFVSSIVANFDPSLEVERSNTETPPKLTGGLTPRLIGRTACHVQCWRRRIAAA